MGKIAKHASDGMDNESHNNDPIEIIHRDGFVEIIIKSKVFIRNESKVFKSLTIDLFNKEPLSFLIYFKNCGYISSEGLGAIADFWRRCEEGKENNGCKAACLFSDDPDNELLDFFEIIGLARIMGDSIFTDYENAATYLKSRN